MGFWDVREGKGEDEWADERMGSVEVGAIGDGLCLKRVTYLCCRMEKIYCSMTTFKYNLDCICVYMMHALRFKNGIQ